MSQTVIVILIVLLAAAAAAVRLYRFFRKPPPGTACTPDACSHCPYHTGSGCGEKNHKN